MAAEHPNEAKALMDKKTNVDIATVDKNSDGCPSERSILTAWYIKALDCRLPQGEGRPWSASWLHFGPLSGIFAMTMVCASLVTSLGILAGSDGKKTDSWPTPPSTYLAIFTAIANLSMRYAALQGVVIAWWGRALKGSTVSRLHLDWRSGTSILGAVTNGRQMGLLGLACLLSTFVVIDGPILQRASTVVLANESLTLNISMTPEIPHGYTGSWGSCENLGMDNLRVNYVFNSTIPTISGTQRNIYFGGQAPDTANATYRCSTDEPIAGAVRGCPGQCKARIQAPALFPTACRTQTVAVDTRMPFNVSAVTENIQGAPLEVEAFFITVDILLDSHEAINIITGYTTYNDDCTGELSYSICTLESAVGEYDILIDNDRIMMSALPAPTLVALANNTAVSYEKSSTSFGNVSTLGGLQDYIASAWESNVIYASHGRSLEAVIDLPLGSLPFILPGGNFNCPSHRDPQEFMFNKLNKLMVYYGAEAAKKDKAYLEANMDPGLQGENPVTGYAQEYHNVHATNYWWFLGAALVEVVCILLILPTYWGYWRIGRTVSFSPLEIAKAFESPLLEDCNSNTTGGDIAHNARNKPVKYGRVEIKKRWKLAFGNPAFVGPPLNGTRFDF